MFEGFPFRRIHWNMLFWLVFVVVGVSVLFGLLVPMFSLDMVSMILGLIVIVIGSGKLAEELYNRKILSQQKYLYGRLDNVTEELDKTSKTIDNQVRRTDYRFHKIEKNRLSDEKRANEKYRQLAKKIISMENKANRLSKHIVDLETVLKARQIKLKPSFEQNVLTLVKKVPRGKVTTYKEIAKFLRKPKDTMNVGRILAKDVYLKTVPIHRVVRTDGKLGGYGGYGKKAVKTKRELLMKERIKVEKNRVDLNKHMFSFHEIF